MMTVLFVALTVLLLIAAEWYRVHRRQRLADAAVATMVAADALADAGVPGELFWHPGHTWVQPLPERLVKIGTSEFAAGFSGQPGQIELPRVGRRLHQGEPAWTLVSPKGRRLTQLMPVDGRVMAVNRTLFEDPRQIRRGPRRGGWILLVRPRHLEKSLPNLLQHGAADGWLEATREAVTRTLSPACGVVAHDGGDWVPDFGDRLDDRDWEAIRSEVFPKLASTETGR